MKTRWWGWLDKRAQREYDPIEIRYGLNTSRWSSSLEPTHMFCPTPGRSAITEMLCLAKVSLGPTPDTINSCGDWNAPADKTTSLLAERVYTFPSVSTWTPVALLLASNMIFLPSVDWNTYSLGFFNAGSKKAVSDDSRVIVECSMVLIQYEDPISLPLVNPLIGRIPISARPFCAHEEKAWA